MLITWDDTFSVKVREIDEQHKKWFEIINELHNSLIAGTTREYSGMTERTLKAMRDYARYHFTFEEEYMRKINYPDLAVHKTIHDKFYVKVKQLYDDVQEGKMVLNSEIMKTLTNWLHEHILSEDMKYSRFGATRKKKKILIADDDIQVHELILAVLTSDEFEIIHAYDGQETVKHINNERPDLVVLDIMMPIRDGRDICKDIKNNPETKDIRVLMLSAKDEQFDRILGLELGADNYMVKPFSPNDLARKIKKMCEKE